MGIQNSMIFKNVGENDDVNYPMVGSRYGFYP